MVVVPLVMSIAACNDNPGAFKGSITTGPTVPLAVTLTPSLIGLTSLPGFNCPAFSGAFNVVIVASTSDLNMSAATFRLIDGTTVGGPSVTIPTDNLTNSFGSTLILAGTSRSFAMHPVFGCSGLHPQQLTADIVVTDRQGTSHTLSATASVR